MVTIIGYFEATNEDDEPFNMLRLQGEIEMVKSKETGKPYITARKASIPCTFEDHVCEGLIGNKLPGEIQRVSCEPYEYEIPESGEKIILEHTWEYNPEPVAGNMEEHVFNGKPAGLEVS